MPSPRWGGEAFLVYFLTRGRITNVLSHNKCTAGSGEFFVQQIGRMGLCMEDAIQLSLEGKVVPLASRCSVHCKSDITHKLNRKEASPADILQADMPLLAYESDGYAVSPSFLRQVEVHIEPVLERAGQRNEKALTAKPWRPFSPGSKAKCV